MNHVFKLSLLAAAIVTTSAQAEEFRQHDAHVHGVVELNIAQDGNELLMEIHAPGADVVGFESAPKNAEQTKQLKEALATLNQANNVMTLSSAAHCKATFTEVRHTLGEDESHDDHDHDKHEHHDHDKHDHDKHEHHDHDKHDHDKHEHHDHDMHDHDKHEHHDHDKHDHDKHEHHDHDKHDHDKHEHHDHDKHDHDKHEHHDHEGHDHEEHGGHGEFIVEYHFDCEHIEKLSQIDTQWFKQFPSTEKMSVNMITDKAQVATELTPNNHKVSF
ncbi:DUF2796 domain-containing protein [Vibrio sp. SCSIO 43132]|uniref:zinc uptake protein ZrgA n=1 Tax=Vibrio sp. SCSIO 43132 TaxID=2779363 RepID=UPI001CA94699|nr:DUF2796 domain-containing protein [Vibrio sp. SCSIO 43132]UAB69996.1 DUF2796 domain-containing protein [Vibrio sp. SCSIO 43132]